MWELRNGSDRCHDYTWWSILFMKGKKTWSGPAICINYIVHFDIEKDYARAQEWIWSSIDALITHDGPCCKATSNEFRDWSTAFLSPAIEYSIVSARGLSDMCGSRRGWAMIHSSSIAGVDRDIQRPLVALRGDYWEPCRWQEGIRRKEMISSGKIPQTIVKPPLGVILLLLE